jgi:hypothetical protein
VLFGLFPAFIGIARKTDALAAAGELESIARSEIERILGNVPTSWAGNAAKAALGELIVVRQTIVRGIIEEKFDAADLIDGLAAEGKQP